MGNNSYREVLLRGHSQAVEVQVPDDADYDVIQWYDKSVIEFFESPELHEEHKESPTEVDRVDTGINEPSCLHGDGNTQCMGTREGNNIGEIPKANKNINTDVFWFESNLVSGSEAQCNIPSPNPRPIIPNSIHTHLSCSNETIGNSPRPDLNSQLHGTLSVDGGESNSGNYIPDSHEKSREKGSNREVDGDLT
ncbi:hypothetical protein L1987_32716 [Smallanthus sonchifolius]|uniref:Uncharacterized protein n=1 Tax=Smallanthus sonchifolius TaxID=185202 RepID=A0ACB9HNT5_9ASTR|nr:hypothetical protein L1987_32716 [Smallanthus sonchifolius]